MAYKPTWVANAFLERAWNEGVSDVDQLKIQKLVYCLHGWNLAITGEPIVGEYFEAWPYGPVLSSLYHEFKGAGRNPISSYADDIDPKTGERKSLKVRSSDSAFYDVFDRVWRRYRIYSGLQLSALTHAEGTPWRSARERRDDYLSNEEIQNHFLSLARSS